MQRGSETLGTTEEDTGFGGCVNLANRPENHVPVGATKVGGRTETSDGILLSVGVVDHNVRCVVSLDLCSEILSCLLVCGSCLKGSEA